MIIIEHHRPSRSLRNRTHSSVLRVLAQGILGVVLGFGCLLGGLGLGNVRIGLGLVERIPGLVYKVSGLVGSLVFEIAGRIDNFAADLLGKVLRLSITLMVAP